MSSLADQAIKPHALLTRQQEHEQSMLLLARVTVHREDHQGRFVAGCMFCMVRATDCIEAQNMREAEAQAFLAQQDRSFVLESIRHLRNALGSEAPTWMFKAGYMA